MLISFVAPWAHMGTRSGDFKKCLELCFEDELVGMGSYSEDVMHESVGRLEGVGRWGVCDTL